MQSMYNLQHKLSPRFRKCVHCHHLLEPEIIADESKNYFILEMFSVYFIAHEIILKSFYENLSQYKKFTSNW